METRANFLLIGAFTLLGLLGLMGFLLWLAKVDINRQYKYYDVLFDNVSGLSTAGDVRFNGLPVGSVVSLALDDDDPSKVRVKLEVNATTPVKTDTIARLQSLGVTGVSYVDLSGGSSSAALMENGGVIKSEKSTIETVLEGAPKLLNSAIDLIDDIRKVVDPANRKAITDVLDNLASASGRLDTVLTDFEGLSSDLGQAAREVAGFTDRLGTLSDTAETTLKTATETLTTANSAIQRAETTIDAATTTLDSAQDAFQTADNLMKNQLADFVTEGTSTARAIQSAVTELQPSAKATLEAAETLAQNQLPELLQEVTKTAQTVESQITNLGQDASKLMTRYEEVGTTLEARLQQSQSAISAFETATRSANTTIESIGKTADTATQFIEVEGRELAVEASNVMEAARRAEARLSVLIDKANATLTIVDREAVALSTDARVMIETATARLRQAETTLNGIDVAIVEATETMSSIKSTSDSVNTLVTGEGAQLVEQASAAAREARAAIATINASVQADLPDLMTNLRETAETANRVIGKVGEDVSNAADQVTGLVTDGKEALTTATTTFQNANKTLEAVTAAMDTAKTTLGTIDKTFVSVDRIISQDIGEIAKDVREATNAFTTTVTSLSADINKVSAEVLSASTSASNLIGTVEGIVVDNRRQMSDFLRLGLPQFQGFVEEAQRLVSNLDRLVDRIERDPARFLLGTQSREFRR